MPGMSQKSPSLWTQLPQSTQSPCDRYLHACCTHGGNVYVLGGRGKHFLRDFWRYSVVHNEWTELDCSSEDAPEELEEHSMVAYQGFLYVFGGMLDCAYTEWRCPLWVFDTAKQKWVNWQGKRSLPQVQWPKNRKGHSCVVFSPDMLVYGGYVGMRGSSQEFWSLNLDTMAWSQLQGDQQSPSGPGPRHSHSAVVYQESMYLYGGLQGLREQRDFWRWSLSSRSWSCIKAMSGPSKLVGHSATTYKACMLLFGGGQSQGSVRNCLWKYSFDTRSWERLAGLHGSDTPARIYHCCVGLGPSYQPPVGKSCKSCHSLSSEPKPSLLEGKLRPFKNKCFPSSPPPPLPETGDAIELETFRPSVGRTLKELELDGGGGLTFENQAFSRQWSCEDKEEELRREEEEESISHHLPDLLLLLGGKPLSGSPAISVWQMTLVDG